MTGSPSRRKRSQAARKPPPPSETFEQQIHQIHELLERFEAEVTWNDYVVDPDQPTRRRQIDITIKRGEHLTLIECRLHRSPQNVKWIEELIGRRHSLRANAVIAVSSAGFTSGAVAKAEAHGIAIRDLRKLTSEEVQVWGRSIALTLYFFAYSDVRLTIVFGASSLPNLRMDDLRTELARHPALISIFNAAAKMVGQRLIPATRDQGLTVEFGARLELEQVRLCNEPVIDVHIDGKAKMVWQDVKAPIVSDYGSPVDTDGRRKVIVERLPLGDTSIVHDGDRISTFVDLSHLHMPPLHQFRYVQIQSPHEVEHEVFSLGGIEKLRIQDGAIQVAIVGQIEP